MAGSPTARLTTRTVLAALVVLCLVATAARAHGPCRCLPRTAHPGDVVAVDHVFRSVWNPTRRDITYGEPALVAAHVEGTPRLIVLRRDRKDAARPATFVVPDVRPGRYLVLLYDGTEGGAHYTWDSITVRGEALPPSRDGGVPAVAIAAGVALIALAGLAVRHSRRSG